MFISKWWSGCASDKYKTICNGFLDHPFNSDVVMTDIGFDITEDMAIQGTTLCIPLFTKGKSQISHREVKTSRELSSLQIHVECAIEQIKHY